MVFKVLNLVTTSSLYNRSMLISTEDYKFDSMFDEIMRSELPEDELLGEGFYRRIFFRKHKIILNLRKVMLHKHEKYGNL